MIWYLIIVLSVYKGGGPVAIPMQSENACMNAAILQIKGNQSAIASHEIDTKAYCINTKTGEIFPDKDGKW